MNRVGEDARRLEAALQLVGVLDFEESAETIQNRFRNRGFEQAVKDLNNRWEAQLSIGPYVIYSAKRQAYWNHELGWLATNLAANGYPWDAPEVLDASSLSGDSEAVFVRYHAHETH